MKNYLDYFLEQRLNSADGRSLRLPAPTRGGCRHLRAEHGDGTEVFQLHPEIHPL